MSAYISNFRLPNIWPFASRSQQNLQPPSLGITSIYQFIQWMNSADFNLMKFERARGDLKRCLQAERFNHQQLHQFIERILFWGASTEDPVKVIKILAEALELDKLVDLSREKAFQQGVPFISLTDWAKERAEFCPSPVVYKPPGRAKGWKVTVIQLLHFIPNLLNMFISSLSYLDCYKKYISHWDRFALIDVLYKFFLVPFALIQILNHCVTQDKVYLVAGAIIFGISLAVAAYKRWIMPRFQEVLNCENLERQIAGGEIEAKVGTSPALNRIESSLLTGNVLLVGDSGIGKTSLVEQLVQHKIEGKLHPALQRLRTLKFDCAGLIGNNNYGYSEMMYQTKDQIESMDDLLIFFDELDQLTAGGQSCMEAFKSYFLHEQSHRCIAATTRNGYEKICAFDLDGSLRRRFETIVVQPPTRAQTCLVLRDYLRREASDLHVTDGAINRLVTLIEQTPAYLPNIGTIAKAKSLLKQVIGQCRYSFSADAIPYVLAETRNGYQELAARVRNFLGTQQEGQMAEVRALKGRLAYLEADFGVHKYHRDRIQQTVSRQKIFKEQYFSITRQVASIQPAAPRINDEIKKLYLLYEFYGIKAFQTQLDINLQQAYFQRGEHAEMNYRIDEALVDKVFNEARLLP